MGNSILTTVAPGVTRMDWGDEDRFDGTIEALLASGIVKEDWLQDGKTPFKGLRNGKQRIARTRKFIVDGRKGKSWIDAKGIFAAVVIECTPEERAARRKANEIAGTTTEEPKFQANLWNGLIERTCATFKVGDIAYDEIVRELVEISRPFALYDVTNCGWRWGYIIRYFGGRECFSAAGKLSARDGDVVHLKLLNPAQARTDWKGKPDPQLPRAS